MTLEQAQLKFDQWVQNERDSVSHKENPKLKSNNNE